MEGVQLFATIMGIGLTLGLLICIFALFRNSYIEAKAEGKNHWLVNLSKAAKGATQHTNS